MAYAVANLDTVRSDPIDEWLVKGGDGETRPRKWDCDCCRTVFEMSGSSTSHYVTFDATRFLGEGEATDDPVWLAQCVVRESKEM